MTFSSDKMYGNNMDATHNRNRNLSTTAIDGTLTVEPASSRWPARPTSQLLELTPFLTPMAPIQLHGWYVLQQTGPDVDDVTLTEGVLVFLCAQPAPAFVPGPAGHRARPREGLSGEPLPPNYKWRVGLLRMDSMPLAMIPQKPDHPIMGIASASVAPQDAIHSFRTECIMIARAMDQAPDSPQALVRTVWIG